MPAYILADVQISDPAGFRAYQDQVAATLVSYGGTFIVRNGRNAVLEGGWQPHNLVLLAFPSYEQAKAWYEGPEYTPLIADRMKTSTATIVLVDGV